MTEAFRKGTNTALEPAEKRTLLAVNFSTKATPATWRKLQKLEAGSQTQLSTLVEEAFNVCNNKDIVEKANKDKRLINITQLFGC